MDKLNNRQSDILSRLQTKEPLQVEELADLFEVSQQTVRKDINQMCDQGLVRRIHGGVSLPAPLKNTSFDSRELKNSNLKERLGKLAAEQIPDGSSILLGIGTTALFAARALNSHKDLRIATNNLRAADILCGQPNHDVFISGGQLRHSDQDVVGEQTTRFFDGFYADIGLIGVGAIHPELGLMEYDPLEADVARAIARNSKTLILVADHTKWFKKATIKSLPFDHVDQFVTSEIQDSLLSKLPMECETHLLVT